MRYIIIDNISFTTINNQTVNIKDIREYPEYTKSIGLTIRSNDRIDEIASRRDIYGDGAEDQSYKIIDFNIVKLYENNFDLSKLKELEIPNQ